MADPTAGNSTSEAATTEAAADAMPPTPEQHNQAQHHLQRSLEGLAEDFQYNLKLLKERDEELKQSDVQMHALRMRCADLEAELTKSKSEVHLCKAQIKTLQLENANLKSERTRSGMRASGSGVPLAAFASAANGSLDAADGASRVDAEAHYMTLLDEAERKFNERYEGLYQDYAAAKLELATRAEQQGGGKASLQQGGSKDNELAFLKHELDCEQHLRSEAQRELELGRLQVEEYKKGLLQEYESKCLALMLHLKSVEASVSGQQKENDSLRGRAALCESRLAAFEGNVLGVAKAVAAEEAKWLERDRRDGGAPAASALASTDGDATPDDDPLGFILRWVKEQLRRLEGAEDHARAAEIKFHATNYKLKAAVPLINLAYAYCSSASHAGSEELHRRYDHLMKLKPIAKAILQYLKADDGDAGPIQVGALPIHAETRRLRNLGEHGLSVFCSD